MGTLRVFYAAALVVSLTGGASTAQNITIENVTVIDGNGGPPVVGQTIVVRNGRIAQISSAKISSSNKSQRINGQGKFLIPGLFDVHIHVPRAPANSAPDAPDPGLTSLHSFLYSGVTAVFDAGNNADYIMKLRTAERAGELLSPRIFAAGAVITYPKSWSAGPNAMLVDNWPAGQAAVDANLARKPDLQKITYENFGAGANAWVPSFSPELFTEVTRYVIGRGARPVVHISDEAHVRVAIDAGVDRLAHPVAVGKMTPELSSLLAKKDVMTATTLAVFDNIASIANDSNYLDRPELRAVMEPKQIEELRTTGRNQYTNIGWGSWFKSTLAFSQDNVRKLHDAGAALALGTDRALGPLVHRELELIVAAGISPSDAIKIATLNSARYLGQENDLGTIVPGKKADMVLLNANPIDDIRNVSQIVAVYKGGVEIDRRKLSLPINRSN